MSCSSNGTAAFLRACAALLFLFSWGVAGAQIPQKLNYQGYLTTSGGAPISASLPMVFKLYTVSSGGLEVYSETQTVTVANGIFNVVLGAVTPFPPTVTFDTPYYLGVTAGTDIEMSPRQLVAASPYTLRAINADALAPSATVAGTQITGTIGTAQLANNAVTQAKLSPVSGAANGKVLGTDGSNLQWQTAGAGTVTSVATGTGLTGGPITATGTINLAPTQLLPAVACTANQIPKWNGSAWACQADSNSGGTVTSVATGTGLSGGPITGAGTITLAATQLLPAVACAATQIPKWSGSAWTCAPGDFGAITGNLTLAQSSIVGSGNIMKGAFPFIHNFGSANTFVGLVAGNFTMTGNSNTVIGVDAFTSNTTGTQNTASGRNALAFNNSGSYNTAIGANALLNNTSGVDNTATGVNALLNNNTGFDNTASGMNALLSNTFGSKNTAAGFDALRSNTSGGYNTASGSGALQYNTDGSSNTASGGDALRANQLGNHNTAIGDQALTNLFIGNNNTAVGDQALRDSTAGSSNTAIGYKALIQAAGSNNTALGANAGVNATGSGNLYLGNEGLPGENDAIRIGSGGGPGGNHKHFYVWPVSITQVSGVPVLISSAGELGVATSSRRFKDDIADMDATSSALMKLRPVTFHYKTDQNSSTRTLQYGLIAEEVAEVYPELVAHSPDGQIQTVLYQFLPPMLLNEYQKQQRTIDAQTTELVRQAEEMAGQTTRIAELERDRQLQLARMAELEHDRQLQVARIDALERQAAEVAMLKTQVAQLARAGSSVPTESRDGVDVKLAATARAMP